MIFHSPAYLFLLLLLVPVIGWYVWQHRSTNAAFTLSDTSWNKPSLSPRAYLIHLPVVLLCLGIVMLSIALARPQMSNRWSEDETEGIDIMMAIDISGTMLAEDLDPNRLEAAKQVAKEFIANRPNDNIGLVVFAGESFTQCPLTTDHTSLIGLFDAVEYGMIEDGTAIGLGLATAVNRMKDSKTKSKVVILLTDGSNNRGEIDPQTAAQIAQTFGIRVYAVGVGKHGQVRMPVNTPIGRQYVMMDSEFDEQTLRNIASATGGEYFRATDNDSLKRIYEQIDRLEKSKIRVREFSRRTENFMPFLSAALILIVLATLLKCFVLRPITE